MPFYPALPRYEPQQSGMSALIGGIGAGQELYSRNLINQARSLALDRERGRQSALESYSQSKDPTELMKYDPELVMKLDKAGQERLSAGIELFDKISPYLEANPGNNEMWAAAAQDLTKAGAPQSIIQGFTDRNPDERLGYLKSLRQNAIQAKADLTRATAGAQVGEHVKGQQALWKTVQQPAQKMEQDFKIRLTNLDFDKRKSLQENQQNWHTAESKRKESLERELKDAKTTEAREQHFFTNLRHEQTQLEKSYLKSIEDINKTYPAGPERDAQELQLRRSLDQMQDKVNGTYKAWADKYKIPFAHEPKQPASPTAAGPPPGTDTNFDGAKAVIDMMPAGQAKDAKMGQLLDRWRSLQRKAPGAM